MAIFGRQKGEAFTYKREPFSQICTLTQINLYSHDERAKRFGLIRGKCFYISVTTKSSKSQVSLVKKFFESICCSKISK